MAFGNALGDRQAQTGPTGLATARAFKAVKGIEHSFEFRCRNARAFVLNSDLKSFVVVIDFDQG